MHVQNGGLLELSVVFNRIKVQQMWMPYTLEATFFVLFLFHLRGKMFNSVILVQYLPNPVFEAFRFLNVGSFLGSFAMYSKLMAATIFVLNLDSIPALNDHFFSVNKK